MAKKSTKRALLMSFLSILLCVSMLVGTTYAWFTDSVTSGSNVIKSGSLDIVLEYWDGDSWEDAEGKIIPFVAADGRSEILWEPGCTYKMAPFRVRNVGTLAAKLLITLNGIKGDEKLMEAIELTTTVNNIPDSILSGSQASIYQKYNNATVSPFFGTPDGTVIFDWSVMGKGVVSPNSGHTDTTPEFTLAGHMKEHAGNEYQNLSIEGISITVLATQEVYEYDSFGREYDKDTDFDFAHVSNSNELKQALQNKKKNIILTKNILADSEYAVDYSANINGNGYTIERAPSTGSAAQPYAGKIFTVKENNTLTLENVTVDGGAVWGGTVNEVLKRGTVNSGVSATGALVVTEKNATVVLNEGAVLQNNDGANAVNLGTRVGAKLVVNGGEIINNSSAAGAIWGGGEIVLNSGKINSNYGGIGGAIRVVTNVGTVLTMNGGEMNHNYSEGVGGAIWAGSSKSNNVYVLNGGEMAYNYSAQAGGAIYAGYYETVKIGGTFKMHDNAAPAAGAIRFHDHASFEMTGGEIYKNGDNSLFLNNNSATVTGGKITDSFNYSGGLGLVWGEGELDGVITYNLSTNHNTAYLAESFNTLKFFVNEAGAYFANFNFKPAAGYVYTEGDEAKLICMNAGYETYWDATSQTFRLQAK